MNRRNFDIDHIDPRWKDGRDYQLVCGLDCPNNLREEDPGINSAKSNRFLPWRWSREDLGVVPEEPGDLAQFLVNGEWVLMEFLSEEWFKSSVGTCSRSHRKINLESLATGRQKFRRDNPEQYLDLIGNLINSGKSWIEANKGLHKQLSTNGRREFCAQNPEWENQRSEKSKEGFKIWFDNLTEEERCERSQIISETTKKAMANMSSEKKQIMVNGSKEGAKKQHSQRWMCTVTGYITTPGPLSIYQKKRNIDTSNRVRLQ